MSCVTNKQTELLLSTHNKGTASSFAERVLAWFDEYGRKNLPWQQAITPYRVWISEIMLQQTQVATVIPYYQRFIQKFPDCLTLADAIQDEVLKYWSGLGYYSRARNLHKAAQMIRDNWAGEFPSNMNDVVQLPGIGRSTAAAILSIAFHQREAILDGNVKRVLARYHTVEGWTGKSDVQKQLWHLAEDALPLHEQLKVKERIADYTQAMMDIGATICVRSKPKCQLCPLNKDCQALALGVTHVFPHPKPKKRLPEKSCLMLVLQNEAQAILLEKRPTIGVWGGLWAFPQFEDQQQMEHWLEQRYPNAASASELIRIKHTFSHYHLHIQAIMMKVSTNAASSTRIMEADNCLWYNVHQEFNGGLPQPIDQILNQIRNQQ